MLGCDEWKECFAMSRADTSVARIIANIKTNSNRRSIMDNSGEKEASNVLILDRSGLNLKVLISDVARHR